MDTLTLIANLAEELCDARQHTEPVPEWTRARNRRVRRVWVTTQPGLLAQLADAVTPGGRDPDAAGGGGFASRPPLQLEALSRLAAIGVAAARWCWSARVDLRDTTEGNIRALVGAAGGMDEDARRALVAEMRSWRTWCAVMTGWATPLYTPQVKCPVIDCQRAGALRINLAARSALCGACGSVWDEQDGSITVLAEYIRGAAARPPARVPLSAGGEQGYHRA